MTRLVFRSIADRLSIRLRLAAGVALAMLSFGCASQPIGIRPMEYEIAVRIDPAQHRIEGTAVCRFEMIEPAKHAGKPAAIALALHPDLTIEDVQLDGATLLRTAQKAAAKPANAPNDETHQRQLPTEHILHVRDASPSITATVRYGGILHQDVNAGEKEGEIHNFQMSAHIDTEGIYLDEGGAWYPIFDPPEDADPELALAQYKLAAEPIDGFELVAGLESAKDSPAADDMLHWRSPYPLPRIVLLGGPRKRWSRQHGDITLHAVLAPEKDAVAEDVLTLIGDLLDAYQPLIGPYPFSEFTVLEAFFSSGFAFPTCTQLVGNRLTEYQPYRMHGYLDHELLHCWWGNGIYVHPNDGNWCEALASYGANYYGYILDDDETGARKKRRDASNFLSSLKPKDDKPLGTFGKKGGAGRGIGYQKGAAVFTMLEHMIGRDAFFAGLRKLTAEEMGKFTNWATIQAAFESTSHRDLEPFFDQWVRRGGAPTLHLEGAEWKPGADQLGVWIAQGDTRFDLEVPLRLYYDTRAVDVTVRIHKDKDFATVPCETTGLTAVELDPDYRLFRKLSPEQVMPTSSLTRRAKALTIVVPDGELADGYKTVQESYTESITGTPDEPKPGRTANVVSASAVSVDTLSQSDALILGDAVRQPEIASWLQSTESPVTWTDAGFTIDGVDYNAPGQAVFFTVHHPNLPESGVTVYSGNSPEALANAGILAFYANSLLVFETPTGDSHGRTEVIKRIDFESTDRIEF